MPLPCGVLTIRRTKLKSTSLRIVTESDALRTRSTDLECVLSRLDIFPEGFQLATHPPVSHLV